MRKVVIIGGVAGGASCAARLRRLDETAQIVVLERGPHISYANCGLPYHVGDVIRNERALLLQTPELMRARFNIEVRVLNEVTAIDRDAKQVHVRRIDSGEEYDEGYDSLVIATGSSPVRPPLPGIDSARVRTLWTVPDTIALRQLVQGASGAAVRDAVVVGGGFIGLEMVENLRHAGCSVTLVEAADHVMPTLDFEMAQLIHEELSANGVGLRLGVGVSGFEDLPNGVRVLLADGSTLDSELVVLSIGVRPNGQLAADAGLATNARGGVVVDAQLRTSDPDIYAVGDVIEVSDLVSGDPTMIPLAGPANKQGRMAADNICGANKSYRGSQGTSIARVFGLAAASVGASEAALVRRGLARDSDFSVVTVRQNSHAGYYPGAKPLALKLTYAPDGSRIFGAQVVGAEGADKRIDVIATTQRLGGSVSDLAELELAYAPPFSSAKDPVNMLGFVACNQMDGIVRIASWDELETNPEAVALDVREDAERLASAIPGSQHIPLGQLRERIGELDPSREIVIVCGVGVRAHTASRILMQHGFERIKVYPGGMAFYLSTHFVANDHRTAAAAE